jgi:hypothetical protein
MRLSLLPPPPLPWISFFIRFKRDSQQSSLEHLLKPTSADKRDCVNWAGFDFAGAILDGEPGGSVDAAPGISPATVCGVCGGLG